jgi:hypothetical protein
MNYPAAASDARYALPLIPVVLFACAQSAQSNPAAPGVARSQTANAVPPIAITVPEDTPIPVLANAAITTRQAETGQPISFTVAENVLVNDTVAIPRGALVQGVVVRSRKSGVLSGSPELTLKLVSLELGGRVYSLYSYQFRVTGMSKTRPTEAKATRGAAIGGVIGASTALDNSRDPGTNQVITTTAGLAAGAGVGTLVSAASPGPAVVIPAEAQLDFSLAAPIFVTPVSDPEAARLAEGLHRGGPVLYVRGQTP